MFHTLFRTLFVSGMAALSIMLLSFPSVGQENRQEWEEEVTLANTEALLEAQSLSERGLALYREKKFADAIPLELKSLEINHKILKTHETVATNLSNLGSLYLALEKYEDAKSYFQQALGMREELYIDAHPFVVTSLNHLASLYQALGQYDDAESYYLKALEMNQKLYIGDHPSVALSLSEIGLLYNDLEQPKEAESYFKQALDMRERLYLGDHAAIALSLNNLATSYHLQGLYQKAESLYLEVLEMHQNIYISDHPDKIHTLRNLAQLYKTEGRYREAEPVYRQALEMTVRLYKNVHPDIASIQNDLATLYSSQGRYQEAKPLLQQALDIRKKIYARDHPTVATSIHNLGSLYDSLGRYKDAESLYRQALQMSQRIHSGDHPSIAAGFNNLGLLFYFQGKYDDAESFLRDALQMNQRLYDEEHIRIMLSANNLGLLNFSKGAYDEAESYFRDALRMNKELHESNDLYLASILNNLALLYTERRQYDDAIVFFEQTLQIYQRLSLGNHSNVASSLRNLADLHQDREDFSKALLYFSQAAEVEEAVLSQNLLVGSERQKRQFLSLFSHSTDTYLSFHLQDVSSDAEAAQLAFTTLLRRKGRILDIMGESFAVLRQRLNPSERSLLDRLNFLNQQISELTSNPESDGEEVVQLERQAETLQEQLFDRSSLLSPATAPATMEAVREAMPDDSALVEFVEYRPFDAGANRGKRWLPPRYAAYILLPDGTLTWQDLGLASEIDQVVKDYNANLRTSWEAYGREAYDRIFAPIADQLGSATHLLISPDSTLNLLPFASLVAPDNTYLLDTYRITYLSSGRDLLRMEQLSDTQLQPPLLIADPAFNEADAPPPPPEGTSRSSQRSASISEMTFGSLQFAKAEAEAIEPLFPDIRSFTGVQATENVLKQSRSPRFLHIATHGFFESNPVPEQRDDRLGGELQPFRGENPLLLSGLALAGFNERESGSEDGVLTALEVTGIDLLDTELVVLSACDTGLGTVEAGEGVYGLRRAFTLAGAQSQVMSLWNVDDESTKNLMVSYYKLLQQGVGRSEALRQVQQDMSKDPRYESPHFWAAFIPTGNWRPLASASK